MDFQDVYNYEIIEDIFQDNKVEDHFNKFSDHPIYDVNEDVLTSILDRED